MKEFELNIGGRLSEVGSVVLHREQLESEQQSNKAGFNQKNFEYFPNYLL